MGSGPAVSAEELIPEIERWANRALTISPRCSRAWSALFWAGIMRPSVDCRKLLDYGLKAVTTGPQDSLAHTTLGTALSQNSNELALPPVLESRRLDPLYVYSYFNASGALTRLGRPAEALAMAEEGLRIEPDVAYGLRMKFSSLIGLGRRNDLLESSSNGQHLSGIRCRSTLWRWNGRNRQSRRGVESSRGVRGQRADAQQRAATD